MYVLLYIVILFLLNAIVNYITIAIYCIENILSTLTGYNHINNLKILILLNFFQDKMIHNLIIKKLIFINCHESKL